MGTIGCPIILVISGFTILVGTFCHHKPDLEEYKLPSKFMFIDKQVTINI